MEEKYQMTEEEFEQRLETFSDYTAELILDTSSISRETARKVISLVEDTSLTEQQLIEKLLELQKEYNDLAKSRMLLLEKQNGISKKHPKR